MCGWVISRKENESESESERKMEIRNRFDGIQLNEYREFATVPFIDEIFTNIETICSSKKKWPDL